MKTKRHFFLVLTLLSFSFMLFAFSCKKESTDTFCTTKRTEYLSVTNKEGIVVYSNKYNRYAISFDSTKPNNIDNQVIGFVCNLNSELKNVGLKVLVSGTLKIFNANENMTPEIGGQELYFFETTQLIKK